VAEFAKGLAAGRACKWRSFCLGKYRPDLRLPCCAAARTRRFGNSAAARISRPFRCRIYGSWDVVQLLVRVERVDTKPVSGGAGLDVVRGYAVAADWGFCQRMPVAVYATETVLGDAGPQRPETFRLLAPGILGMVRRCGNLCISLRSGLLNAAANKVAVKNQSLSLHLLTSYPR